MEARSKRYLSWEESNNNIGVNNNARGPKWQVATKKPNQQLRGFILCSITTQEDPTPT
jgi:hypothetical protein